MRPVSETVIAPPAPLTPADAGASAARATFGDYVDILKPRIMLWVVITTVGAMGFAAHGWPGTWLLIATIAGMCLCSGGSSALNHWYDRDIDLLMARTADRPVASGRIAARDALVIGNVLGLAGVLWLGILVNWPAALWALAGFLCYVLVYTVWLKRRTPQNIVIGGAAGALPPLVGWAAVRGSVGGTAVILFFIVFFWTPPHFWALSLLMKDEYAKVGVPMLPVVRGEAETRRQRVPYTLLLYAVTQLPG